MLRDQITLCPSERPWIPAFAGMTEYAGVYVAVCTPHPSLLALRYSPLAPRPSPFSKPKSDVPAIEFFDLAEDVFFEMAGRRGVGALNPRPNFHGLVNCFLHGAARSDGCRSKEVSRHVPVFIGLVHRAPETHPQPQFRRKADRPPGVPVIRIYLKGARSCSLHMAKTE